MSFLSSLLCCFDLQDNERQETSITSHHPKLTKTHSSIQRALSNRPSQTQLASKSSLDLHSSKTHQSKKPGSQHTDKKSSASPNAESRKMDDTLSHEQATIKAAAVSEITDLKDSTDSSKDDETISQEQQHSDSQQQYDKEQHNLMLQKQAIPRSMDSGPSNEVTTKTVEDDEIMDDEDEEEGSFQDEEMDEDQFEALDLTRIQTDQVVAPSGWLLDPPSETFKGKKCLVLDLDETLVHSSFKYIRHSDFVIPVEIENQVHNVYVIKRPGVDEFLKRCGEIYEVVVFTASVSRYGDPLLDILDMHKSVHHRLFRESCYNYQGNYIKNLSQMGRPLRDLIIIDNSPASYIFHPQHSVPISSWFSDTHDCELTDLLPFLEDLASSDVDDVGLVLDVNL